MIYFILAMYKVVEAALLVVIPFITITGIYYLFMHLRDKE
jgi:hypothetical protein